MRSANATMPSTSSSSSWPEGQSIRAEGSTSAESQPVFARRHTQVSIEGQPHSVRRAVTARVGNLADRHRRLFEVSARALEPRHLDELPGGHADLAGKDAREVAGAHAGQLAEALDRQVGARILRDVGDDIADSLVVRLQPGQLHAELRLI